MTVQDPTTVVAQNIEQTTCLFSLLLYSFMDVLVLSGYRRGFGKQDNERLFAVEELPLLADRDWTKNIVAKGFKVSCMAHRTPPAELLINRGAVS